MRWRATARATSLAILATTVMPARRTTRCECAGESAVAGYINPNACNYNPDAVESDGHRRSLRRRGCQHVERRVQRRVRMRGRVPVASTRTLATTLMRWRATARATSLAILATTVMPARRTTRTTTRARSKRERHQIDVSLFPNPVRSWLNVDLFLLFDMTGRQWMLGTCDPRASTFVLASMCCPSAGQKGRFGTRTFLGFDGLTAFRIGYEKGPSDGALFGVWGD